VPFRVYKPQFFAGGGSKHLELFSCNGRTLVIKAGYSGGRAEGGMGEEVPPYVPSKEKA
jgi:hypothetical protein